VSRRSVRHFGKHYVLKHVTESQYDADPVTQILNCMGHYQQKINSLCPETVWDIYLTLSTNDIVFVFSNSTKYLCKWIPIWRMAFYWIPMWMQNPWNKSCSNSATMGHSTNTVIVSRNSLRHLCKCASKWKICGSIFGQSLLTLNYFWCVAINFVPCFAKMCLRHLRNITNFFAKSAIETKFCKHLKTQKIYPCEATTYSFTQKTPKNTENLPLRSNYILVHPKNNKTKKSKQFANKTMPT